MLLHELTPKHKSKDKKPRVGRGGKRGTTAGKGQKGQKSRSGRRIRPAERDYIQRLHKLRGIKNKPTGLKLDVLNVGDLEKHAQNGILNENILGRRVKILGNGEIKTAITVEGFPVSGSAKKKIEVAGGKII